MIALRMLVAALLLIGLDSAGQAQTPAGLDSYQQHTRVIVNNARDLIEPVLSLEERTIAVSVRYRVTASRGVGASASVPDGQRLIVIHAGIVQVIEWISDAILIEGELSRPGCVRDYMAYLGPAIIQNTERTSAGLAPNAVSPPARFTTGSCSGVTPAQFAAVPRIGDRKAGLIEASILFLYLHELGHHVKRHTASSPSGSLAMSRANEDEADRWAIATALKARQSLAAALPIFHLIAATGGNSIEAELKATHPLGVRRFMTLFAEIRDFYKANPTAWGNPSTYAQMMSHLEKDMNTLHAALPN
jgi:hypothetical protein